MSIHASSFLLYLLAIVGGLTLIYELLMFLNKKFAWFSTNKLILKFDSPNSEDWHKIKNYMKYHNIQVLVFSIVMVVIALICVFAVFMNYRSLKKFELAYMYERLPSITPVIGKDVRITSGYGNRIHPITGRQEFHAAEDYRGEYIVAAAAGRVLVNDWGAGYGNYIKIVHSQNEGSADLTTLYGHLSRHNFVKEGQYVRKGQIIGVVGNTGISLGKHLHYEVSYNGSKKPPKTFSANRNKIFNRLAGYYAARYYNLNDKARGSYSNYVANNFLNKKSHSVLTAYIPVDELRILNRVKRFTNVRLNRIS